MRTLFDAPLLPPPQGSNRRIFYPRFFMLLSNYLLITTTTLHSVYSNDVNSLFKRQMLLSVCPDATAAWRRSLEGQNSCLVLNWHFARRTGTLGPPTSSGAAAIVPFFSARRPSPKVESCKHHTMMVFDQQDKDSNLESIWCG